MRKLIPVFFAVSLLLACSARASDSELGTSMQILTTSGYGCLVIGGGLATAAALTTKSGYMRDARDGCILGATLGAMGGVIDPVFAAEAPSESQLNEESSSPDQQ